jgi:hypothetical protein
MWRSRLYSSPLSAAVIHFEEEIPNFVIHGHHRTNLTAYNKELRIHDYQPAKAVYRSPNRRAFTNGQPICQHLCGQTLIGLVQEPGYFTGLPKNTDI